MSTPTLEPRTVRSSELSRHPAEVFAAAEEGPIVVTRRDGESLVLTTQERAVQQQELLGVAAQLIAASLEDGPIADRFVRYFPWIGLLNEVDRDECAAEIVAVARGSFSVGQPQRLLTVIAAWRDTAEAVAAGWGARAPEWLPEDVPAPDPRS
ncbi:MAG: hypothetical protein QM619_09505 [Micropruina sp.]|uniref:prevent-host-death protein n=1 Tax=Micropruina sp. TaxID=2737536 RepID=UPI0039E26EB9